jgi:hypothetical protein
MNKIQMTKTKQNSIRFEFVFLNLEFICHMMLVI